jgi:hypothetical protein
MPSLGFEPTNSVFQRAKIFHALDWAATVIGINVHSRQRIMHSFVPSFLAAGKCFEAVALLSHESPVRLWTYKGENHGGEEDKRRKE